MIMKDPSNGCIDRFESDEDYEPPIDVEENEDPDFTEYLWMENVEEFDKMELQRLEEEELMNDCIEAMMDHEIEEQLAKENEFLFFNEMEHFTSNLNPLADEFIPASLRSSAV